MTTKIKECSSPRLLSTGSLVNLNSLLLIAEGISKYSSSSILNVVIFLIAAYYVFDAEYPKGVSGHRKCIFFFLENILINKQSTMLPMGVDNCIARMDA